jgi:TonB family protein
MSRSNEKDGKEGLMKNGPLVVAAVALALLGCREASQDDGPRVQAKQAPPEAAQVTEQPATAKTEAGEPIHRVGGAVSRPELIHRVEIDFARLPGIQITGVPVLEAVISENGTVESVRMLKPTDPKLEDLLLDAVKQWRFRPAMKDGKPVRVYYTLTLNIHWQ